MTHVIKWVVVCDAVTACIYRIEKKKDDIAKVDEMHDMIINNYQFHLVRELKHPESRLKNARLVTDKSGHYKTSTTTRGKFVEHISHHNLEQVEFSREIADFLIKSYNKKQYQQLILCAEPHFWGLLKKQLSPPVVNAIKQIVQKDYMPSQRKGLLKITELL